VATILTLPQQHQLSPSPDGFGEELLSALGDLQQEEDALRSDLVKDSWEDAYHAGIRIELAGVAFHVLSSLPLSDPPVTFLAATKTRLEKHQEQLQAASNVPYTGKAHGHFDGIAKAQAVIDHFLEMRLDSPTP
jgi:hypothetical protein